MLSQTLFYLESFLDVVLLVIGLVELISLNAVEVLPHVEFLIFWHFAVKPGIIEHTAFF